MRYLALIPAFAMLFACGFAHGAAPAAVDETAASQKIDALVAAALAEAGAKPNPPTDDATFLRRAYLKIVGTIPTVEQARRFLDSTAPDKRARLIDELLASPGYGSHFFNEWAELLRIKMARRPPDFYGTWVRQSLSDNKPYDVFVRELLTASGHEQQNPAVGYFLRDPNLALDNASNTAQVFMGTQIGCAQCHDHPFEAWTQRQFYGFAAATNNIHWRYPLKRVQGAIALIEARTDLPDAEKQAMRSWLLRSCYDTVADEAGKRLELPENYAYDDGKPGEPIEPTALFDPPLDRSAKSEREAFARWLTSPENPRFTLVIANRLWKRAMGRGLIEPVDDLTDDSRASIPELMTYLTQLMRDLRFDMRAYQRILYNTATWQRACSTDELDLEKPYLFAGPLLDRMTTEQVWDSLLTMSIDDLDATLQPPNAGPNPLQPCLSIFDQTDEQLVADVAALRARFPDAPSNIREARRLTQGKGALIRASELGQGLGPSHLLFTFGRGEREAIQDSNVEPSVTQALALMNGEEGSRMFDRKSPLMREVAAAATPEAKLDALFLGLLGRLPTADERAAELPAFRDSPEAAATDLAWILLNTHEFIFIR
jgi:hypothetical protein